jgi:hypothetical protein
MPEEAGNFALVNAERNIRIFDRRNTVLPDLLSGKQQAAVLGGTAKPAPENP